MQVSHAFVLKNFFPQKHKVVVFHDLYGKITCFSSPKNQVARLCNGSFIRCMVSKKNNHYQLDVVDIDFVLFDCNKYDIYFVHDVLKICYNILPFHAATPELFGLLEEVYKNLSIISSQQKKVYLLQIFLLLGIFPEDPQIYMIVTQNNKPLSDLQDEKIDKALLFCWNLFDENKVVGFYDTF